MSIHEICSLPGGFLILLLYWPQTPGLPALTPTVPAEGVYGLN